MKMRRADRVGDQYQKELADLLQNELKDPRVPFLTSVTEVHMSQDMSHATAYISLLGKPEEKVACLKALEKASGFLRRELAQRVRLRISPELHFKLDESLERGAEMSRLIDETLRKDAEIRKESHIQQEEDTAS